MSKRGRLSLAVVALVAVIAATALLFAARGAPTPRESDREVPESADAASRPPGLSAPAGATATAKETSSSTISLTGRVLDDRRSPVADASVEAAERGEAGHATRTRSDGRFRVEGLGRPADGWQSVAVLARGSDGRVGIGSTTFLRRSSPDVVDVGDVVLGDGAELAVRVVDGGGAVRDAQVALAGDRVWLLRTVTGADGVARFRPMPPRLMNVLAWTSEPPRAGRGGISPGGTTGDSVTIEIAPARTVEVLVVEEPGGRPIEGATFDVVPTNTGVPAGGAYGLGPPAVNPTGADGRTRVLGTVHGDELVLSRARAPRFDGEGWGRLGPDERETRLEMRARRTLRFEVQEGEAPIPPDGALIRLEPADEGAPTPLGRARMEGRTLVVEGATPLAFVATAVAADDSYARLFAQSELPPPWDRGSPPAPQPLAPISFRRPRRVRVVALRPDAIPAQGAWFVVATFSNQPVGAARASDAEGRAEFDGLRVTESLSVRLLEDASRPYSGRRVGTADLAKGDAQVTVVVPDRRRFRVRTTVDGRAGLPPRYRLDVDGVAVESAQEDPAAGALDFSAGVDLDASDVTVAISAYPLSSARARVAPVPERDPIEVEIPLRSPGSLTCRVTVPADGAYELHVERWDAERSAWIHADGTVGMDGCRPGSDGLLRLRATASSA